MTHLPFPHQWSELSQEETSRIKAGFPDSAFNDLIRYDNGVVISRSFIPFSEKLYNFQLREDDIWIITYPKTGTTWTQEMVWMLINNVDKVKGAVPQMMRSPFLEIGAILANYSPDSGEMPPLFADALRDPLAYASKMPGRRVLKSHLPLEFLPPGLTTKCKVIYVARSPRDTCVSFYHHNLVMPGHGFIGDFAEFAGIFKDGLALFGDYWSHLFSGWKARNNPNVKFLWFEDMKKNQRKIIEDMCVFLDHNLTPGQVDSLVDHLKFENIKANPYVNPTYGLKLKEGNFMRKGEVGDWKNYFTAEKTEEWAKWISEKTRGTDLAEKMPSF